MEDEEQAMAAGRRRSRGSNAALTARTQALERLKALRNGESRPSYDIKMDAPIYDTVDEDEYKDLVAKRREEFSDFIVGEAGDGYIDDGEEEDWTKAGVSFSSDEEFDGEGGDRLKRKKKEKVEKPEKEKKPSATANALSAAAALMGKQRISSMFTTSVFKKRSEEKGKGMLASDNVVDDVIAEFALDDEDRERRRRPKSKNLGLGLGLGLGVNKVNVSESCMKVEDDNRLLSSDLARKVEVIDDKVVVEAGDDFNDLGLNHELKQCEGDFNGVNDKEEKLAVVVESKVDSDLKEDDHKVFAFNAKIKEEKVQSFSAAAEWKTINDAGKGNGAECKPAERSSVMETDEKPEFVLETDGSLPFYILDAYEEMYGANPGTIYLFGKVSYCLIFSLF